MLVGGIFPALQFTSLNSMIYADISPRDAGRATSLGSVVQQMSLGLGVTVAGLVLHISHWLQGHQKMMWSDFWPAFSWSGCARSHRFRSRGGCRPAPATKSRAASGNSDQADGREITRGAKRAKEQPPARQNRKIQKSADIHTGPVHSRMDVRSGAGSPDGG